MYRPITAQCILVGLPGAQTTEKGDEVWRIVQYLVMKVRMAIVSEVQIARGEPTGSIISHSPF
jgi:hypothetical protein